jgi:hypothetical protein
MATRAVTRAPLSPQQIATTVSTSQSQGWSWQQIVGVMRSSTGITLVQIVQGLQKAGWSTAKIQEATNYSPSLLQSFLSAAGSSAIAIPGTLGGLAAALSADFGAAGAAAGDAASGASTATKAAGGGGAAAVAKKAASSGASTAAKDVAGAVAATSITALLVDPKFLFRALKFIGGLLLAWFGIKQLASAGGASIPGPRIPVPV